MRISESILAPLRLLAGSQSKALRIDDLWRGASSVPMTFTGTWIEFESDLAEPVHLGDGPSGRDSLEIVLLLAFTKLVPKLPASQEWYALDHQCGGVACNHQTMIACRMKPLAQVYSALQKIAQDRWPFDAGDRIDSFHSEIFARHLAAYKADLGKLGLHCNETGQYLTEALYPIDATQEHLDIMLGDPPNLRIMLGDYEPRYIPGNLVIFAIAANSD